MTDDELLNMAQEVEQKLSQNGGDMCAWNTDEVVSVILEALKKVQGEQP